MQHMTRRNALRALAGTAGGLTGLASSAPDPRASSGPDVDDAWNYHQLEPRDAARGAYSAYPGNGCMFAVMSGIVGTLAARHGEPYRSFPLAMARYGHGGVGGYGCLCGALNGAAAVIGLFHPQQRTRDLLITELFKWYEQTELPIFEPAGPAPVSAPRSRAGSILCHASIANWCRTSSGNPYDKARSERCRRLSADVTAKAAELLNRTRDFGRQEITVTDQSAACMQCHAESAAPRVTVRSLMNCSSCHDVATPHRAPKP